MSYEQYSKATKETAENLRIIDDAMFRLVRGEKEYVRRYSVRYWVNQS